jgi:hypothetical protein
MDDAEQEARQHQAHGDFGINARTAIVSAVEPGNLAWQPAQIKNAINPHQNMVVGDQVSQRPGDEQFQLTAFPPTQHCRLSITDKRSESDTWDFFNSPHRTDFRAPFTIIVRQVWMAASLSSGCRSRLPVGAASQVMEGSNQIVSEPRRLSASLWLGQFRVLSVGGVGLLMQSSYHAGLTR